MLFNHTIFFRYPLPIIRFPCFCAFADILSTRRHSCTMFSSSPLDPRVTSWVSCTVFWLLPATFSAPYATPSPRNYGGRLGPHTIVFYLPIQHVPSTCTKYFCTIPSSFEFLKDNPSGEVSDSVDLGLHSADQLQSYKIAYREWFPSLCGDFVM